VRIDGLGSGRDWSRKLLVTKRIISGVYLLAWKGDGRAKEAYEWKFSLCATDVTKENLFYIIRFDTCSLDGSCREC